MKQEWMTVFKSVVTYALTLGSLIFLLYLSALVPEAAIYPNLESSALALLEEDPKAMVVENSYHSMKDNYADAVLLGVIANVSSEAPYYTMINTRYYDGEEYGEAYGVYARIHGTPSNTDYTRYWHGSMTVLRPLLAVTDLDGIKVVTAVTMILCYGLLCVMLVRKKMAPLAVMFLLSLLSVQVWYVPHSVEFAITFVIMGVITPLYVRFYKEDDKLILLSVISGCVTAFADFLTTETITLLVPLLLVYGMREEEGLNKSFRENVFHLIKNGAAYLAAYAMTFVTKWCLAGSLTGENAFAIAMSAAGERVNGEAEFDGPLAQIGAALLANLTKLFPADSYMDGGLVAGGLFLCAVITGLVLLFFGEKEKRKREKKKGICALFFIIACIPLLRFLVLNNHSYLHGYFTYRALMVSVLAMMLTIWQLVDKGKGRKKGKKRKT